MIDRPASFVVGRRTDSSGDQQSPSIQALEKVITAVGPTANPVQYVHGLVGLIQWLKFVSSL